MEKNEPLISVIIPVYKVEQYLDRCVNSIVNQTYQNIEIILVDDGSPDKCPEMCDEWVKRDERIRVIHKENGGLSSARNNGLDMCRGYYINFVDSDDWIPEDSLHYLYDLRKKYEADFSMASYVRDCHKTPARNDFIECELSQQEFLTKFFKIGAQENVQYSWAKLYKKELFETVRFPIGLTCEDIVTTFQIALRSKKIAYSTNIVYFYYLNPSSITEMEFSDQKFDLLKVWDKVCQEAYQFDERWILSKALFNRKRADFGILMDLAVSKNSLGQKIKYLPKVKKNIFDLRKNVFELCNSDVPFSRKIFIICFSINYPICLFILHYISKLRYRVMRESEKNILK